jgi:hypothetical protein
MSEPIDTADHIIAAMQRIASLPTPQITSRETFRPTEERKPLSRANGWEKRYIRAFDRPAGEWETTHARICTIIAAGGICCLIGNRGTGKTQHAAEAAKDHQPLALYATAMGVFLDARAAMDAKGDSEKRVVKALVDAPMLVIDEAQERGGTPWEDRILNHVIDRRYAAMIPTIIIANAKPDALVASLGESIADRMRETGGIIEITGKSHRGKP